LARRHLVVGGALVIQGEERIVVGLRP
jgi:hypothetical protein